jgi:hypothetical protein
MSDLVIGGRALKAPDTFRTGTVVLILAIGILGFVGMLILGAFAPDLRSGRDGGPHALSNAGIGFSGIVALAGATGRNPIIVRNEHQIGSEDLLVVTPGSGYTQLGNFFYARSVKPTLYILPKWQAEADPDHRGWVELAGTLPAEDPGSLMAPAMPFKIERRRSGKHALVATPLFDSAVRFTAPPLLQVITGAKPGKDKANRYRTIHPLLTDGAGGIVVARVGEGPLYVLADPDLMSNVGVKDPRQAAAALAMLDWMNSNGATSIGFDVTSNGLGHGSSPLKLAFTPPFLAMTLALAAVLLLVGWHAIGRFGPIRSRDRAIALGKAMLVENSAKLMRRAGREAQLGGRYAQVIREQAVAAFGIPAGLKEAALDEYLDRFGGNGRRRFSELAQAAELADDRISVVEAAQALHEWQEKIR